MAHYRDLLSARPDSYWAHYRISAVLLRLNTAEEALRHLAPCVARQPESPTLLVLRANALERSRRYGEARRACDAALRLAPGFEPAILARLFIESRSPNPGPIGSLLDYYAMVTESRGRLPLLRASRYSATPGTGPVAGQWLGNAREAVGARPKDVDLRFTHASELYANHLWQEALDEYSRIIEAAPSHLPARYNRAALLQRHKGSAEAIDDLLYIIDDPRLEELILRTNGMAILAFHVVAADLISRGRNDEAIRLSQRGLELADRFGGWRGEAYYNLARAYAAASRDDPTLLDGAASNLSLAVRISPKLVAARFYGDPAFKGLRPALANAMEPGPDR